MTRRYILATDILPMGIALIYSLESGYIAISEDRARCTIH